MVTLHQIRSSNSQIATALPPGLVAVFAGATSGIGETSLKQFVKHAVKPRVYFLGRSKESGNRIRAELQKLNPKGEYIFIGANLSLLRNVDDICRDIKAKESAINLLFLSAGSAVTGKDTEEGLHFPVAIAYYSRLRFIVNLLPLLRKATGLRRVVTVLAGTKEGPVMTDDFQLRKTSLFSPAARGHVTAMTTLALEIIAKTAPDVSFVHDYPGAVKSNLGNDVEGLGFALFRLVFKTIWFVFGSLFETPVDEAGERHLFFATSARFPAAGGDTSVVPLTDGITVARGTNGTAGSGVYSIDNHGESAPPKVEQLFATMRQDGTAKKVWADVEGEFVRITGAASI